MIKTSNIWTISVPVRKIQGTVIISLFQCCEKLRLENTLEDAVVIIFHMDDQKIILECAEKSKI